MSWTKAYRLALCVLPQALRRRHGTAMEALFVRELERARARGSLHGALAGAAGVWDAVRRGIYEWARPASDAMSEPRDHRSRERWDMDAHPQPAGGSLGRPQMPQLTTRQLLRRLAISFGIAFLALTASLLAVYAFRRVPALLGERGASVGSFVRMLLLAVPFTAAMTIPMAVLIAVLRELTRLGADGALAPLAHPGSVRRLLVPLLVASVGIAALELVVVAEVVPRTNARLLAELAGGTPSLSDRAMTIGELQAAARSVRSRSEPDVRYAARFEIEIQKKLALPAACVVMAVVAATIALRVRRRGSWLVIIASAVVFGTYYVMLVMGESLADRLVVSPFVGMWAGNAFLLAAALLALWWRRAPLASSGNAAIA